MMITIVFGGVGVGVDARKISLFRVAIRAVRRSEIADNDVPLKRCPSII